MIDYDNILPMVFLVAMVPFSVWAAVRTVRGRFGRSLNWAIGAWLVGLALIAARSVAIFLSGTNGPFIPFDRTVYLGILGLMVLLMALIVALAWREDRTRRRKATK